MIQYTGILLIKAMRKVLITGGSGFIGYHLVRRLHQDCVSDNNVSVRCLVRPSSSRALLEPFDIEYSVGELSDGDSLRKALDGCDTVFHLAGLVRAKNKQDFMTVNCTGTENLVTAASQCPTPPVFIYVSSLAAAGPSTPTQPRLETDAPAPISLYGKSKLAGEKALLSYASQVPCTIVRPSIVFGEADRMNLELFMTIKKLGLCPIPGFTMKYYSWIHAADLCDILVAAAEKGERLEQNKPIGTGIYFAAADGGRKLSEIGRLIGESVGKASLKTVRCPPAVLWSVSTFYEIKQRLSGKPQPYDWAKAWESLHHWTCSPEKACTQLDFSPRPLEERFNQTAKWFLDNGWL